MPEKTSVYKKILEILELIAERLRTPKEIIQEEGFLEVTITQFGVERTKAKKIKVRPFVSHPAYVTVEMGALVKDPDDQYQNSRFSYKISLPCYPEEWRDVRKKLDVELTELSKKKIKFLSQSAKDV